MLKTIDLFAGAGGMSLGFELTGNYMIVAAAENNSYAMETYMANHTGVKFEAINDVRGYDFNRRHRCRNRWSALPGFFQC